MKFLFFACISLFFFPSIFLSAPLYTNGNSKNILILHSLMERNTWAVTFNSVLSTELSKHPNFSAQIYYETTGPIHNPAYILEFLDLLKSKYQNTRIDAIIAVLPAACNFIYQHGQKVFPNIPVIYASPSAQLLPSLKNQIVITRNSQEAKETLDRIFLLRPKTKKVFFIYGRAVNDLELFSFYKQAIKDIPQLKEPVFLEGLALDELLQTVSSLPPDSAIFFIAVTLDRYNNHYISYQLIPLISKAANAPVFSYYDSILGQGIVGGKLSSVKSYALKSSEIINRLFRGDNPRLINFNTVFALDQYDYRQLQRWGISESFLPQGSEVFYKDPSYLEKNWPILLISLSIILAQGMLIFLLKRSLSKTKKAEKEIRKLNESLEQRVLERTAQLENTNKELETFSYSVSHDLRAPLRAIDGFGQIILEDYADKLDPQGIHYLSRIREGTKNMGFLIDALLNLSRLSRSEIKKSTVNLSQTANLIMQELKATAPERKIDLQIQDNLTAFCDEKLIHAALQNLFSNAFKFTSKKELAKIEFKSVLQDQAIIFYIKDNGAGFDMAYYQKLFGAFQRLHHKTDFEGIGIGLATVLRIIHRHGGRIWAEGKVDQGATFYFTLPSL